MVEMNKSVRKEMKVREKQWVTQLEEFPLRANKRER